MIQDVLDGKQLLLPQSGECLPLSETSDTNLTIENQVEQDHQQREEPEMVIINPSVIQSDMKILGREKMLHIIDLFRNTSADVLGQLVESAEKMTA